MKWSILAAVAMTSTTPAAAVTIVAANRMLDVASGRYVDKGR